MPKMDPCILIIDDDSTSRLVASAALKRFGYNCHQAHNGAEALIALSERVFHVVLLDWILPDFNGGELLKKIRSGEGGIRNLNIPVIVVTADLIRCSKELAMTLGANDHLTKPYNIGELSDKIATFLTAV
ncbi:MAG: response regulator [Geobacteraceae bacterium]|nr:response regulator [Geobacteraceae bacterium]